MIRALVLDFDGLMMDTESALIQAYADVHARHGVAFDRELFLRNVGQADYSFDPWLGFAKWADRAALETERRARNKELDRELPVLPGVAKLLAGARTASLQLGMASNSSHPHVDGHLKRLGLFERFAWIACREDVSSPKPEPDLYRLVLNRLGLASKEAVAFEDSNPGSLAAKRAGLWTVAVPGVSSLHQDFDHADLRLRSLAACDLPELIARFEECAR
ncbi:MAG: HAD family hydrolase [Opitutaceae bacterium]